ncbi:MAG: hypothetical protein B6D46_08450 [Polyangiaceae bacterium UTPRO1]|nr:DUF3106 domain-containing protein [Myxococcales bacterium]OQY66975.1 MAG: hypothetical protein B6D46_08450 [Polyangiaceae bacterium UTPRO1]
MSRRLIAVLAAGSAALLFGAPPALAIDRLAQSWQEMSPQERDEAYRNYQRFQKMPPEQQRRIERNYDRWQQLPPQEKERLRSTYRRYRELPSQQRQDLDRRFEDRRRQRD